MSETWRLVLDYRPDGSLFETYTHCPACWAEEPIPEKRDRLGQTVVRELRSPVHPDVACYRCERHPETATATPSLVTT